MGAPMSYLLDPSVPWPPPSKARRDLLQRLLCDWSEPELDALFAFCRLGRAELVSLAQRLHGVEHPTLCRD